MRFAYWPEIVESLPMKYQPIPIFKTERLILRPLADQDYQLLRELDTDPLVVKYLGHGRVRSEQETLSNLQKIIRDYQKYGLGLYAVEDAVSGEFLGRSGLIPWQLENTLMWEIGFTFKPAAWGKGFASESAKFLLEWGFQNLEVSFLISLIHPENQKSIQVAEKIGMSYWKDILIGKDSLAAYRIAK